jgi:cytochrome c oxidase subunit III
MDIVSVEQKKKIHPHKFTLWVAIASIVMMFAGLTSAFIVKANQTNFKLITIPKVFWISTAVILISSITLQAGLRAFKQRAMSQYRVLMAVTLILGVVFVILQWMGFDELWATGITFQGSGAGQFLYVIFGLHAIHVVGGVIVLIVMLLKAFSAKVKLYSSVPLEVTATYWHFVDLLWIYLLVFFMVLGGN